MEAPARPPAVGIVGTFDVANYGDLLFPYLAEFELGRRLGGIELRRYSYHEQRPPGWCYAVEPIERLVADLPELDLLLLGGGLLVRVDQDVAPGYRPPGEVLPHPLGYWWTPALAAAAHGVPVAWNALGTMAELPGWARGLVAGAARAAAQVSVRDADGLALLEWAGVEGARLVPDTAFGVARVFPAGRGAAARPYVILQPSAALRDREALLASAAEDLLGRGIDVVAVPISPCLGDGPDALALPDGVRTVDPWPSPPELAALIAGARAVVAHSLHLSITAAASGVPVWRCPPQARTKHASLHELAAVRVLPDDPAALADALEAGERVTDPGLGERMAALDAHWDRLAALVREPGDPNATRWAAARGTGEAGRALLEAGEHGDREITRLGGSLAFAEERVAALEERLAGYSAAYEAEAERAAVLQEALDRALQGADDWRASYEELKDRRVVRLGLGLSERTARVRGAARRRS